MNVVTPFLHPDPSRKTDEHNKRPFKIEMSFFMALAKIKPNIMIGHKGLQANFINSNESRNRHHTISVTASILS